MSDVLMFPAEFKVGIDSPDQDTIDDVSVYEAVDLYTGTLMGEIGVIASADEHYGYDALWSWVEIAGNGNYATIPFPSREAAFDDFLREVER